MLASTFSVQSNELLFHSSSRILSLYYIIHFFEMRLKFRSFVKCSKIHWMIERQIEPFCRGSASEKECDMLYKVWCRYYWRCVYWNLGGVIYSNIYILFARCAIHTVCFLPPQSRFSPFITAFAVAAVGRDAVATTTVVVFFIFFLTRPTFHVAE